MHLFYAENVYDNIKHQFFQQSIAIIADQKEHFWIYRQWIPVFFFFFFYSFNNAKEEKCRRGNKQYLKTEEKLWHWYGLFFIAFSMERKGETENILLFTFFLTFWKLR